MKPNYEFNGKPLMLVETAVSGLLSGDLKEASVTLELPKLWVQSDDSKEDYGFMSIGGILFTSTYRRIGFELAKLCAQKDKVIVIIDSPGGVATGMLDCADKIYELRKKATIYVIVSDGCYSAAFGLASAASKIFLARNAGVGSVGVISTHVDQSKYDENLGVNITAIIAGDKKNDFSSHSPLSERAHADVQKHVDSIYEDFCRTVAWNRGISVDTVKGTQAGIFHEQDAVNIGFVDEIASFEKAVQTIFSPTKTNKYASASSPTPSATTPKPTPATTVNPLVEDVKRRAKAAAEANPVEKAFDDLAAKRRGENTPTTVDETGGADKNPVTQAFNAIAASRTNTQAENPLIAEAKRIAAAHDAQIKAKDEKQKKLRKAQLAMTESSPSYLH